MTEIFEYGNHILIYTGYSEPVLHKHAATHVFLSWNEMSATVDGKKYNTRGILIPSGALHTADNNSNPMLVFMFDETTDAAEKMNEVRVLPEDLVDNVLESYLLMRSDFGSSAYKEFINKIYKDIGISTSKKVLDDERIAASLLYVDKRIGNKIICKEVAEAVFMSESRFSHLFKECMGITFIGYLQMRQLCYAYNLIINGKSITEAAVMAGFNSSAHFAATNKRVFGLKATDVTSDVKFYKIKQ